MSTVPHDQAPVPFFTDSRTLAEKLECDKREWRPHQPEYECPATIFGLVLERGEYTSDYGNKEVRATAQVLTADNVLWSVIAFHGFLQSEFMRKNPRIGDFVAIAYRGTRPAKRSGENDAHDYVLEVERNPEQQIDHTVTADEGDSTAATSNEPNPEGNDNDIPF